MGFARVREKAGHRTPARTFRPITGGMSANSKTVLHVASVTPASSNRLALQYRYSHDSWQNELLHLTATSREVATMSRRDETIHTLPHVPTLRRDDAVPVRRLRSVLRRTLNALAVSWKLWRSKADLMHAHENSSLWPAVFWSVVLRRPAVWDPHDYFHEDERARSRLGRRNIKEFLERRLVQRGVPVLVVSDGMQRIYGDMYAAVPRYTIRSYSADTRELDAIAPASELVRRRRELSHGKIRIVYPGMIDANRLEPALLTAIGRNAGIEFDIYGIDRTGSYQSEIEGLMQREGISNIRFRGAYSVQDICPILERYHFAIFPFRTIRTNIRICLPNKFFQCVEAGLPILSTDMEELGSIIAHHGLGYVYPSQDAAALSRILEDLSSGNEDYEALVKNVLAFRSTEVDYEGQRSALLDAYDLATARK